MDDKKQTIRDLINRTPEPNVKEPTHVCPSYDPDIEGKCSYWSGRCNAFMYSKASIERLGEDYFCPHMPDFHKQRKKANIEKEVSKEYWTAYWQERLRNSD